LNYPTSPGPDMANKFIVARSTVKLNEKSLKEPSKD
jgi:hypothetical protein